MFVNFLAFVTNHRDHFYFSHLDVCRNDAKDVSGILYSQINGISYTFNRFTFIRVVLLSLLIEMETSNANVLTST